MPTLKTSHEIVARLCAHSNSTRARQLNFTDPTLQLASPKIRANTGWEEAKCRASEDVVEQYRAYVRFLQDGWARCLPSAESAANKHFSRVHLPHSVLRRLRAATQSRLRSQISHARLHRGQIFDERFDSRGPRYTLTVAPCGYSPYRILHKRSANARKIARLSNARETTEISEETLEKSREILGGRKRLEQMPEQLERALATKVRMWRGWRRRDCRACERAVRKWHFYRVCQRCIQCWRLVEAVLDHMVRSKSHIPALANASSLREKEFAITSRGD